MQEQHQKCGEMRAGGGSPPPRDPAARGTPVLKPMAQPSADPPKAAPPGAMAAQANGMGAIGGAGPPPLAMHSWPPPLRLLPVTICGMAPRRRRPTPPLVCPANGPAAVPAGGRDNAGECPPHRTRAADLRLSCVSGHCGAALERTLAVRVHALQRLCIPAISISLHQSIGANRQAAGGGVRSAGARGLLPQTRLGAPRVLRHGTLGITHFQGGLNSPDERAGSRTRFKSKQRKHAPLAPPLHAQNFPPHCR